MRGTDKVLIGTYVNFTFPEGGWSATLVAYFYKAGKNDLMYTTPHVRVRDVSGRTWGWYYWCYTNNDQ
ncbi:MAG: hypothetical protein QXR80_03520 [Desulfurococcaceae archaeon]